MKFNKVIIAGGNGFIGNNLISFFRKYTQEIFILTRRNSQIINGIHYLNWNAKDLDSWQNCLENSDLLINLTGKSIQCLFTEENKKELLNSRVNSVKILNEAILKCKNPPKLFIQASAIGFYGDAIKESDENAPKGNDFLSDLVQKWEQEFFKTSTPNTRKIILRFGLALGKEGGILPPLVTVTKFFLGGSIGKGKNIMNWFHVNELNYIINFLYEHEDLNGIFNVCSPKPITNKAFMKTLRSCFRIPFSPPIPTSIFKFITKNILKREPELIFNNQNVVPKKLKESGYHFRFPNLRETIINLYFNR